MVRRTIQVVVSGLGEYFLGIKVKKTLPMVVSRTETDIGLSRTGTELIERIEDAIVTRRSVIVTGSRGCGKSHCTDEAIRRCFKGTSERPSSIGGWIFIQGNREIPREALSEDTLIIEDGMKKSGELTAPVLRMLKALAIRSIQESESVEPLEKSRLEELRKSHPDFPAIRCDAVKNRVEACKLWTHRDWVVLYLDEITRFADGFLDSLLSLTEEGKVVRRGKDYFVPLLMVATANPPGYDPTAKKLSPPLQARIARSYRLSQPPLDVLVDPIAAQKIRELYDLQQMPTDLKYPENGRLVYLAAAATLCLWGDPDAETKGRYYLDKETRELLRIAKQDSKMRGAMEELSTLITFGPDARAISDWAACAIGLAKRGNRRVTDADFLATALESLSHKVRDNFNEGAEPEKVLRRDACIETIVRRVFTDEGMRTLFLPPFATACELLQPNHSLTDLRSDEVKLKNVVEPLPVDRRIVWLRALQESVQNNDNSFGAWIEHSIICGALVSGGFFASETERDTIVRLFNELHHDSAIAKRLSRIRCYAPSEFDLLITRRSSLREFADLLRRVVESNPALLSSRLQIQIWLEALGDIVDPSKLPQGVFELVGWRFSGKYCKEYSTSWIGHTLNLLADSFKILENHSNSVGRLRATEMQRLLGRISACGFRELGNAVLGPALDSKEVVALHNSLIISGAALVAKLPPEENRTARVTAWFNTLTILMPRITDIRLDEALKVAAKNGALTSNKQFVSAIEKEWACTVLNSNPALQRATAFFNSLNEVDLRNDARNQAREESPKG